MSIPIRAVVLTATSTSIVDIMAAIWAYVGGASAWSQVTETNDTNPGDLSFAIRSPDNALELNFSNNDLVTPSVNHVRVGINPDGLSDPIVDSESPHTDSANFSGIDRGRWLDLSNTVGEAIGSAEFIWLEWSDAVMALFKNAARTLTVKGIHAGKTLIQPLKSLENPGNGSVIRMDGHAVFGAVPGFLNAATRGNWMTDNASFPHSMRSRVALGQSASNTWNVFPVDAWSYTGKLCLIGGTYLTTDAAHKYGPTSERVPLAITATTHNSVMGVDWYLYKYIRAVPPILPPFSTYRVGGVDRYMHIGTSVTPAYRYNSLAVPIPAGFNPNP